MIRKGITFDGQLVGYADLADIDAFEARASLGYAIGNSSLWGQGLGLADAKLMLEFAFTDLKLEIPTEHKKITLLRRDLEVYNFVYYSGKDGVKKH